MCDICIHLRLYLVSVTVDTVANIQPILVDIKVALNVAIGGCKKLTGQSIEVILATEGGVLSVVECGNLVASLVVVSISPLTLFYQPSLAV